MEGITEEDINLKEIVDEVIDELPANDGKRIAKHVAIMGLIIKYWPAQLFIFVEEFKIYAYKRLPLLLKTRCSSQNANKIKNSLIEEYSESKLINKSTISHIKEDLRKYIKNDKEKIVKKRGQWLNTELISEEIETKLEEELQQDDDKNNKILICCKDEDIDYVWEWIYWKDFFWGDKFHIVRLPKDGIPHRELKNSNFQIKKFAAVSDIGCKCTDGDIKYFTELLGEKNYKKIKVQELSPTNLNAIDCIHFVANIETFIKKPALFGVCDTTLNGQNTSNSNGANKQLKFLFLNIRVPTTLTPEDNASELSKLKESFTRAAEIYIDTTFDPPDDSEICFVKSFYGEFQKKKNVVEAATDARRSIGSKKPWRLAYVVRGNPCTEVTWKVDIAALGTLEQKK